MKKKLSVLFLLSVCMTESAVLAYNITDLNAYNTPSDVSARITREEKKLQEETDISKAEPSDITIFDTEDVTVDASVPENNIEKVKASKVLLPPQDKYEEPSTPTPSTSITSTNKKNVSASVPKLVEVPVVDTQSTLDTTTFLALLNTSRQAHGLPALVVNSQLTTMAQYYAQEMLAGDFFGHYAPDGDSLVERANAVGYSYRYLGENLAYLTFGDEQAFLSAWMNSPSHRANILDSKMRETGVAFIQGEFQGESVIMAVQFFGLRR